MIGNLRYEWRRISTARATWILTGCAVVAAALLAEILALTITTLVSASEGRASGGSPELGGMSGSEGRNYTLDNGLFPLDAFVTGSAGSFLTLILLGVVAAQAFGQDYRHGTIRLTLTLFPRRVPVFVSKAVVMGIVIVGAYLASVLAAVLVALPNGRVVSHQMDGVFLATGGRAVLVMLGFALIVFAITVLTRILALGVLIPVVLAVIAEPLLVVLQSWVSWLPKILPFTSGMAFMNGEELLRNGLVYLAWIVVLLGAALLAFLERDA